MAYPTEEEKRKRRKAQEDKEKGGYLGPRLGTPEEDKALSQKIKAEAAAKREADPSIKPQVIAPRLDPEYVKVEKAKLRAQEAKKKKKKALASRKGRGASILTSTQGLGDADFSRPMARESRLLGG